MNFSQVEQQLKALNTKLMASELHGLVTGWLCAGAKQSGITGAAAMGDWFETDVSVEVETLVQTLAKDVLVELADFELGFQLFLPDDDQDINLRQQGLSHWCGGFISGFGLAGRFQEGELDEDIRDVMKDLSNIASLDEEIPDDEENETDMVEIVEYVRMSALMVFTECANKAVH